ncbi:hypothetical protein J6590_048266 [Homalodisca vitripennis]|nr:hypothetical protein J6590_048266 [Homalodisca vitripennis]
MEKAETLFVNAFKKNKRGKERYRCEFKCCHKQTERQTLGYKLCDLRPQHKHLEFSMSLFYCSPTQRENNYLLQFIFRFVKRLKFDFPVTKTLKPNYLHRFDIRDTETTKSNVMCSNRVFYT